MCSAIPVEGIDGNGESKDASLENGDIYAHVDVDADDDADVDDSGEDNDD